MPRLLTALGRRLERLAALGGLLAAVLSCRSKGAEPEPSRSVSAASSSGEASERGAPDGGALLDARAPRERLDGDAGRAAGDGGAARGSAAAERPVRRKLVLERPFDLGPATAIAASAAGVLFRSAPSEIAGIEVAGSTADVLARAAAARSAERAPLSPVVAAPVVTRRGQSYWSARGQLLRRSFNWSARRSEGDVETLASDALDGARIAAVSLNDATDVVVYIARATSEQEDRRARVWATGSAALDLSESGAGASSVTLALAGAHAVAVWIDARAAMSPVHARTIDLAATAAGPLHLGHDVVVFVGPSPEGLAEVNALGYRGEVTAFIPFARTTTTFGLAAVSVGAEPHLDAEVKWTPYPNGIAPAPVASALVCGAPWVAFARPRAAAPDAPAVLQLAPLVDGALGEEISASEGFGFYAVSLAARDTGGAWLSWVGNGRAWVRGLSCP